jgi:Ulp1 family protease
MKYLDKKKIDLFSYTRILIPILIKNKTGSFSYSLKLGLDQNQFEYNTNLYYNQFKPDEDSYHWALISANLKTGKMILYDSKCSFSEEGKNSMQILSKFFDFYIEEKCKNSFLIPNKHGKEAKKLFQQEDDSEMRFESEGSSDEEDIPENSTQITSNQTFNLEDDIYSNCKRVLNFDEGNDISVDKDREFDKSYSRWKFKYANNPKQSATNETDSGVFVCKFLEYITRDESILFDKHDLEYFRILMSVELIESKLITG